MGSCLKMFAAQQQPPAPKPNPMRPPDSDRRILTKTLPEKEKQQSVCGRSNIQMESNSSVRETKIFFKSKSTALFSTDDDRKHSSILQYTLDHESIIKYTNEGVTGNITQEYYTLVDRIAFVKKTMDCLKVTAPDGQSQINCQPQFLFSTLSVSEGKPVDCIEEVAPNKFIQTQISPIKLKLKFKCQKCKKQMKATFCKGIVQLSAMACPSCDSRDNWSIQDITCNFPVWGGGSKIENHQKIEKAPGLLRVMGCVICLKFSNCQNMRCGCHICKPCLAAQQNITLEQQCWMCTSNSVVY